LAGGVVPQDHHKGALVEENPYSAPKAEILESADAAEIPAAVGRKIRIAWIAGVISTSLTLVITVLAMTGVRMLGFSAFQLIDVALMAGLTFGIYKKSRACAVAMFVYFVLSKIVLLRFLGAFGIIQAIAFLYFYGLGMVGTFQYHKLNPGKA
jgi:hypothetical protein